MNDEEAVEQDDDQTVQDVTVEKAASLKEEVSKQLSDSQVKNDKEN